MKAILFILLGSIAIFTVQADWTDFTDEESQFTELTYDELSVDENLYEDILNLEESDISSLSEEDEPEQFKEELLAYKRNRTARRLCIRKYGIAFRRVLRSYRKSMRACSKNLNKVLCREDARTNFKNATLKATDEFHKCLRKACTKKTDKSIENTENFENLNDSEIDTLTYDSEDESLGDIDSHQRNRTAMRICKKKFRIGFRQVIKNYRQSRKACKTSENRKLCKQNVRTEFKNSMMKIVDEYQKCFRAACKKPADESNENFDIFESEIYTTLTCDDNDDDKLYEIEENSDFIKKNRTTIRLCKRKFRTGFRQVLKNYRKSMRVCFKLPNRYLCQQNVRSQLKNSTLRIIDEFHKCVSTAGKITDEKSLENFDEFMTIENISELFENEEIIELSRNETGKRLCRRKYRLAICRNQIKYKKSMRACYNSTNKYECEQNAKVEFNNGKLKAKNELERCIQNTDKFDELIDETNEENLDLSKILECKKKFDPEIKNIRKNLFEALKQCSASEKPMECFRKAWQEFFKVSVELAKKLRECISKKE